MTRRKLEPCFISGRIGDAVFGQQVSDRVVMGGLRGDVGDHLPIDSLADLHLLRCTFDRGFMVSSVVLRRIHAEEVKVKGTDALLLHDCLFDSVRVTGILGGAIVAGPLPQAQHYSAWHDVASDFYSTVDIAIDLRDAAVESLQLLDVPPGKIIIRSDQGVVFPMRRFDDFEKVSGMGSPGQVFRSTVFAARARNLSSVTLVAGAWELARAPDCVAWMKDHGFAETLRS